MSTARPDLVVVMVAGRWDVDSIQAIVVFPEGN